MGILIDKAELLSRSATNCGERIDPDYLERRERELEELEHPTGRAVDAGLSTLLIAACAWVGPHQSERFRG